MSVFDFRPGRTIRNIDPQEAGEELTRLRQKHGQLTPEVVLDAAQEEGSPLHDAFEWDADAAARQWRLAQARKLIVSIRVMDSPAARPVRAFVSVRTPEQGRNYVPTIEALSNDLLRIRVLDEARRAIESLERRYAHFSEVADILSRLKRAVG